MSKSKTTVFQIRIEPELIAEFKRICDSRGMPAAVHIRQFMISVCEREQIRRELMISEEKNMMQQNASNGLTSR